ncbi:MAG TPA: large conductance mechanosensitive channel protein MscL [Chloroflexia bacterium]|nr:large conductance mechanosensitive channel protein MscL [Chloroflexia bacterium]
MWNDFKTFINKGNVISLAVAFVMGAAFSTVVGSLVKDLIMPLVSLLTGGTDFTNWFVSLNGKSYPTLAAAQAAGAATLNFGVFLNSLITFLVVAFSMFLLVRAYEASQPKAAVTTRECPYCMSEIPIGASRCPNCTSEVTPVAAGT